MNLCKLNQCSGKCCVGIIEVFDDDYVDEKYIERKSEMAFMKIRNDNTCIALVDGECSIYKNRPKICRKFSFGSKCCIDFQTGVKKVHNCRNCVLYSADGELL